MCSNDTSVKILAITKCESIGVEVVELDSKVIFVKTTDETIISDIKSYIMRFREENNYN